MQAKFTLYAAGVSVSKFIARPFLAVVDFGRGCTTKQWYENILL